jgi:hypothetical protein
MDSRVQLLLNRFLEGELKTVTPSLDSEMGYRYLDVELFVDEPKYAEPLLQNLEESNLLTSEICGFIAICANCESWNLRRGREDKGWTCQGCGVNFDVGDVNLKPLRCYQISEIGIAETSRWLIANPLIEFLHERGYKTDSPGVIRGQSEVDHSFNIVAFSSGPDEGVLVVDFYLSDEPIGEEQVKNMFAKIYDTTPLKSILVAFPQLTDDARRLAEQYKINIVETTKIENLWKKLIRVIPPVEDFKYESLDVMTLLSLPDHLRKTATIVCSLGFATADKISNETKRARAVESGYLNQLVRMGYLKKERDGRKVIFSVVQ